MIKDVTTYLNELNFKVRKLKNDYMKYETKGRIWKREDKRHTKTIALLIRIRSAIFQAYLEFPSNSLALPANLME